MAPTCPFARVQKAHQRIIGEHAGPDSTRGGPRDHHAFRHPCLSPAGSKLPSRAFLTLMIGRQKRVNAGEGGSLALEGCCVAGTSSSASSWTGARPSGTRYAIQRLELASRLSYFLWSSMPDDEFVRVAAKGQLRTNSKAQVRRMLKDPKSRRSCRIVGQWLRSATWQRSLPTRKSSRISVMTARGRWLASRIVLRGGLARRPQHPGVPRRQIHLRQRAPRPALRHPGVRGQAFQRVRSAAERGGILTQASILALTSTRRGLRRSSAAKWVLEQLLGTPPPPPPPDAGDLEDDAKAQLSARSGSAWSSTVQAKLCRVS